MNRNVDRSTTLLPSAATTPIYLLSIRIAVVFVFTPITIFFPRVGFEGWADVEGLSFVYGKHSHK
jgi:hypothetical protein